MLYAKELERQGFASTRALDIAKAMRLLHAAICQVDSSIPQRQALEHLLRSPLEDTLIEFATIEELRKKF